MAALNEEQGQQKEDATMFGGFIFPFFGALYYWYPKMTGRMYNEKLGKLHFWLMLPAFWVMSIGQMSVGLLGMRRRVADYDPALGIEFTHVLITLSALIIGWSVLIMIYNLVFSQRRQPVADPNPWRSRAPEWQIISPPPELWRQGRVRRPAGGAGHGPCHAHGCRCPSRPG